jgi:hypothetical protein
MFNNFKKSFRKKLLWLSILTISLAWFANTSQASAPVSTSKVQIPGSFTLQKTIYDAKKFAILNSSNAHYDIMSNGTLITFGPDLNYLSSSKTLQEGGGWNYQSDGTPIGITGCKSITFGLDECGAISNLTTGKILVRGQANNPIDTHEISLDSSGNYWFLSYPKTSCETFTACAKFGLPEKKIFSDCVVNQVSPDGTSLFNWKASEHILPSMIVRSYLNEAPRGKYVDIFHCNSIDVVDKNSILLSSRNTNALYLINTSTSNIIWKFGGRYWSGISLLPSGFGRDVGGESIAQHDARSLGNNMFSYFDNESHTNNAARGIIFKVTGSAKSMRATLVSKFDNPNGNNSLCTGSFRPTDFGNFVVGWGCSFNAITIFDGTGSPIVSLDKLETPNTKQLFSHTPLILNGVDWGPRFTYALSYRVIPVLKP